MANIRKLKSKADKFFSLYIRKRDVSKGCVTCGKLLPIKKLHAGHWMGRGAGAVRFDPHNVHAQCPGCNNWGGAKVTETYRRKMVEMYGEEEVDRIYRDSKRAHRFTQEELEEIINTYKDTDPISGSK